MAGRPNGGVDGRTLHNRRSCHARLILRSYVTGCAEQVCRVLEEHGTVMAEAETAPHALEQSRPRTRSRSRMRNEIVGCETLSCLAASRNVPSRAIQ